MGYSLNVGLAMNTVVGMNQSAKIGKNKSTTVGTQYSLKVGGSGSSGGATPQVMSFTGAPVGGASEGGSGSSITMDADSITLTVGQSTITLKSDGTITADGNTIKLTAADEVVTNAGNIHEN
ncbi:hypothetical protein SDC9_162314 [bioreactor metagenome]|uniref:DUF2345 domain-containing protein n=1 Tax=bioreactor metagenome TaxID=1076179 RepID=A0A645FKR3_9ZZZZ